MKPIIGITGSILSNDNEGVFSGYERAYVNDDYVLSISKSSAIPCIMPIIDNDDDIREQVSHFDGIVLSGGYDIDPVYWGEEVHSSLGRIFPRRDNYELKVLKYALEFKKPVLGICRGLQVINVFFGGSLYQDISLVENSYIKHSQCAKPYEATHTYITKENTMMRDIVGEAVRVNSFHHLAIKDLGKDLIVSGYSKDGIIESIEYIKDGYFVLGVQFHPEMMHSHYDFALNIFKRFVSVCIR